MAGETAQLIPRQPDQPPGEALAFERSRKEAQTSSVALGSGAMEKTTYLAIDIPSPSGVPEVETIPDEEPQGVLTTLDTDKVELTEDEMQLTEEDLEEIPDSVSQVVRDRWKLVKRAKEGDPDAFGEIFDLYKDTVLRFIYFRTGNKPLAEDLTQDTFVRALKNIHRFEWQGRDLGAWLVTIGRNLVADHFKSGRYRLEITTGDVLENTDDSNLADSPEVSVIDHITNITLLTAVMKLNDEQRQCIIYRFLSGFSVEETAAAMGKNIGAVKALQFRAVRALGRSLPKDFEP